MLIDASSRRDDNKKKKNKRIDTTDAIIPDFSDTDIAINFLRKDDDSGSDEETGEMAFFDDQYQNNSLVFRTSLSSRPMSVMQTEHSSSRRANTINKKKEALRMLQAMTMDKPPPAFKNRGSMNERCERGVSVS